MAMFRKFAALLAMTAVLAACGGGGGGGSQPPGPSPSPTTGATGATGSLAVGATSQTITLVAASGGTSSTITAPAATSGSGAATATLTASQPSSVPALTSIARGTALVQNAAARTPQAANASTVYGFITFTTNKAFTLGSSPSFTLTLSSAPSPSQYYYVAFYNGSAWTDAFQGPGTVNGTTISFAANASPVIFVPGTTYAFAFYATPTAVPTPAPSPTSSATGVAFTCPTSATVSSVARSSARAAARHGVRTARSAAAGSFTQLAVIYDSSVFKTPAGGRATTQEATAGASFLRQIDLSRSNQLIRVVSVPTSSVAAAQAALRAQYGVVSVGVTGARRSALTATPYYPNDPYFQGFTGSQNAAAGNPATSTFEGAAPYSQSAVVPGQWDMHAIQLEYAFGYSQSTNSLGHANSAALGSSAVHIAIIDTGEDVTHPELATKIVRTKCFITSEAGTGQSTGTYVTDEDGHGTNVAGIAAADLGNGFGFAGAGGNATIFAYRVFPTPDDTCAAGATNPDNQCSTNTLDIASAIVDAVENGANVISLSLGGGSPSGALAGCTGNGVDTDAAEGAAVAYAIKNNVIVVAASGNSFGQGVSAPACDSGVIAVGATSLDDGTPNGSSSVGGNAGGTPGAPAEYVASYSQYGSPATAPGSASAWGIVAPGGDPAGAEGATPTSSVDFYHWINNIWTSTPYLSSPNDPAFAGLCTDDYPGYGSTLPLDCTTLIAGTSMATPHVAGAVALILSVSGTTGVYATPAAMKTLLCQTADDLGPAQKEGCGRLNVYRAMAKVLVDPSPPPPKP